MNDRPFTAQEVERYARHIILPEIGGDGQKKLRDARVLVVGAGGLGSPVLMYLAAAGVGTLDIVDDDVVSLSNLQRQVLHATQNVGTPKTKSAEAAIGAINPHVSVNCHAFRLSDSNAAALIGACDIIVDGSDNFATRYLVADTAAALGKPLVTGALGRFDGSVTVVAPHLTRPDGRQNPTYRDLFPEAPPEGVVPSCAEAGILGAIAGVIGTLQAVEVIKLITGAGDPLIGRILLYDALATRFDVMRYSARP